MSDFIYTEYCGEVLRTPSHLEGLNLNLDPAMSLPKFLWFLTVLLCVHYF